MLIENLGHIDYEKAWTYQKSLLEDIRHGVKEERLLICSHPSTVTLGKKSEASDINGWVGPLFSIERGGRATYHGPGQVIIYPIIDISQRNKDIYLFLENLEKAMVQTLAHYGIQGEGRTFDATGVWINNKKIASIGIAIKRWITYHGLALNLYKDDLAFTGINPCGFKTSDMTSVEELLEEKISRQEFETLLANNLVKLFNNLTVSKTQTV